MRSLRQWLIAASVLAASSSPSFAQTGCPGDCSADGEVTVDEIVTLVNIALGTLPLAQCPAGDTSGDNQVTVDELQAAIITALNGCVLVPTPTPTIGDPTPTVPAVAAIRIDLSTENALPGQEVTIDAILSDAGAETAATSNDITYDRNLVQVKRTTGGGPDCTISSRLGAGTEFDKMLATSILPGSNDHETVRIGLFGINMVPLTDGLLFSCRFELSGDISAQSVVLENVPGAANLNGFDLDNAACTAAGQPLLCCTGAGQGTCTVLGVDGQIVVGGS